MSTTINIDDSATFQLQRKHLPIEPRPVYLAIEQTEDAVICYSDELTTFKNMLYDYFMYYLDRKPQPFIKVIGEHEETRTNTVTETDSEGNTTTRTETTTEWVTDWRASIDISTYVAETWDLLIFGDQASSDKFNSMQDAFDWFNASSEAMKEIKCKKKLIGINIDMISEALTAVAQQAGYRDRICVTLYMKHRSVIARSSSLLGKMLRSCFFWFLMIVTFLWVLMLPVYCVLKRGAKVNLIAMYRVRTNDQNLIQQCSGYVWEAVLNKSSVDVTLGAQSI